MPVNGCCLSSCQFHPAFVIGLTYDLSKNSAPVNYPLSNKNLPIDGVGLSGDFT